MLGTTVSHYRILERLGEGGMGAVYVALDETLKRKVAVKVLRQQQRLSADVSARFLQEARLLSRLDHPHICRAYDYIRGDESDYLILELIDGCDLGVAIGRGLGREQQLGIAIEITDVLATAHAAGIVHRDLKPANVMLMDDGHIKVLDFGIARSFEAGQTEAPADGPQAATPATSERGDATLITDSSDMLNPGTALTLAPDGSVLPPVDAEDAEASLYLETVAGTIVGTPRYMSPEQKRGEMATPASDVYSLGLVMQELFTGESALGRTLQDIRREGHGGRLRGIDNDILSLIEKLQAESPRERPAAGDALDRLHRIQGKPARRLRIAIVSLVITVLAVGAIKYTVDLKEERSVAVAARAEAEQRRRQAEDLIEFMLGDLRAKLEPVGRLDVLNEVGAKALDYYRASETLPVAADAMQEVGVAVRRAKALRQIGEVRSAQGQSEEALQAFDAGRTLLEEALDDDPDNEGALLESSLVHFWIADVYLARNDTARAEAEIARSLARARTLADNHPDNREYQLEVGYGESNLGTLALRSNRADVAREHFLRALAIQQALAAEEPADLELKSAVAGSMSWLGSVERSTFDLERAAFWHRQELSLREQIAAAGDDKRATYDLALTQQLLAGHLFSLGDLKEARALEQAAGQTMTELARFDPDNLEWRAQGYASASRIAQVLIAQGHWADAEDLLTQAKPGLTGLLEEDGQHFMLVRGYARHQMIGARAAFASGDFELAHARAADALEWMQPHLSPSPPRRLLQIYGTASEVLAESARHLGLPDESKAVAQRALDRLGEVAGQDLDLTLTIASLRLLAGLPADALLQEVRRSACRDPLYWRQTLVHAAFSRLLAEAG